VLVRTADDRKMPCHSVCSKLKKRHLQKELLLGPRELVLQALCTQIVADYYCCYYWRAF
jgi:hypothetical protein